MQTDLAAPGKGRSHVNFATLIACNIVGGTGCAPDQFASAFLVFGSATPLSAIPPSGSASYSGRFSLPAPVGNDIADGFIGLSVNFASRNVTGTLSDVAVAVDVGLTGAISRIPDFAITGQLAANGLLSGNLTPGARSSFASGSWAGSFFGPNASEIGGTIMLPTKPGAVDPYYAGTFSAAKQ